MWSLAIELIQSLFHERTIGERYLVCQGKCHLILKAGLDSCCDCEPTKVFKHFTEILPMELNKRVGHNT